MRTPDRRSRFRWLCAAGLAAFVAWLTPATAGAADFTRYHNFQDLTASLKAMAAAHPTSARLLSIGKTREGRDIWALEIANTAGTPVDKRPAVLIAANFEADHLIGSELAIFTADYLLSGADPAVKTQLDTHVFYIVPRMNPDGAEQFFGPVQPWRRTNVTPFDADNDGRVDEDGPEDLNKDGFITLMRVKDPKGPFMISPDDKRLMRRADPTKGERGGYSLYWEGLDKDKDGFIAEDGLGGVDLNRNFMHQYPYYEPDAGRFMASENETRALLDFMIKHRNIAAILSFGESDNLIVTPQRTGDLAAPTPLLLMEFANAGLADARKVGIFSEPAAFGGRGGGRAMMSEEEIAAMFGGGRGGAQAPTLTGRAAMPARRPVTTINAGDFEYFRAISEKYRELTGIRTTPATRAPAGAFFEYGYYQYGVPSFSTPGWGLAAPTRPAGTPDAARPNAAPPAVGGRGGRGGAPVADADGIDLRLLQWMDAEKIDGFVNWTPFKHPSLGDVEIGGFKDLASMNPPAAKIAELGAGHAKFALYLASMLPKVSIASLDVTPLGAGLYRVKAEITNDGYLPTALAHAVMARAVNPLVVQLQVPPESIVTGNEKTVTVPTLAGSGNRKAFEWVVKAKPGSNLTLTLLSQKGGSDSATRTLK